MGVKSTDSLRKYARSLGTAYLQQLVEMLNDEADLLEREAHDVTDIEREIRIMEEELESR